MMSVIRVAIYGAICGPFFPIINYSFAINHPITIYNE
jgi:hypothetical protein